VGVEVEQIGPDALDRYADIPMSYRVESVFEVTPGPDGLPLSEMPLAEP